MTATWRADVSGSLRDDFGCGLQSVPADAHMEVMFRGQDWTGGKAVGDARVYGLGRLKPFVRRLILKSIRREWDVRSSSDSPLASEGLAVMFSFRIATIKAVERTT